MWRSLYDIEMTSRAQLNALLCQRRNPIDKTLGEGQGASIIIISHFWVCLITISSQDRLSSILEPLLQFEYYVHFFYLLLHSWSLHEKCISIEIILSNRHASQIIVWCRLGSRWAPHDHPVQEKTTLWVHPLKNDNVGSAQQTLWVQYF